MLHEGQGFDIRFLDGEAYGSRIACVENVAVINAVDKIAVGVIGVGADDGAGGFAAEYSLHAGFEVIDHENFGVRVVRLDEKLLHRIFVGGSNDGRRFFVVVIAFVEHDEIARCQRRGRHEPVVFGCPIVAEERIDAVNLAFIKRGAHFFISRETLGVDAHVVTVFDVILVNAEDTEQ